MEIRTKYKGFCSRCHYTVWQGEKAWLHGKVRHLDCKAALADRTARELDPRYVGIYGKVNKARLRRAIQAL